MKKITKGKVLILTDIHQSIGAYAEHILERETDWDHIIINGDMLDTFRTPDGHMVYGVTATCLWINEKMEEWGDKVTWHVANHDVAYLASYTKDYTNTKPSPYYYCSGWTKNKAKYFNKEINPEWLNKLELCTQLGDNIVVSHAGFHYRHFKPYMSELDNIKWYYNEWEKDRRIFHREPWHWIWDVGQCRGGQAVVGSPVWLDWNNEFTPIDNVQQIVGHTTTSDVSLRILSNGENLKNWCIDCMQQVYAVWENEEVTVKDISGKILTNKQK